MVTWRKGALFASLGLLLGSASPTVSLAEAPTKYDGTYAALLSCDALPYTQPMVNQPFSLTIKNGQLTYDRDVKMPDGVTSTGVSEHAKGTVTPDGAVTASGRAGTQYWNFTSAFQGQINGPTMHLTGTQSWKLPPNEGGGPFQRNCSITATPKGP